HRSEGRRSLRRRDCPCAAAGGPVRLRDGFASEGDVPVVLGGACVQRDDARSERSPHAAVRHVLPHVSLARGRAAARPSWARGRGDRGQVPAAVRRRDSRRRDKAARKGGKRMTATRTALESVLLEDATSRVLLAPTRGGMVTRWFVGERPILYLEDD